MGTGDKVDKPAGAMCRSGLKRAWTRSSGAELGGRTLGDEGLMDET